MTGQDAANVWRTTEMRRSADTTQGRARKRCAVALAEVTGEDPANRGSVRMDDDCPAAQAAAANMSKMYVTGMADKVAAAETELRAIAISVRAIIFRLCIIIIWFRLHHRCAIV